MVVPAFAQDDQTYGFGKFPFGRCQEPNCPRAACHRMPPRNDNGEKLICHFHLPNECVFVPFLGQQEKLFAAAERYVLGGGGAGMGKTFTGWNLYLKQWTPEQRRYLAAKEAGIHFQSRGWALFCRRTIPELLQVIEDFKRVKDRIGPNRWDQQNKLCVFENGYIVQFAGMEHEEDYLKYYGQAYTLVVFDEATQFTVKQIEQIDSRLRSADEQLSQMLQLYLLTNPVGGETKQWLKRTFYDGIPPETRARREVKLKDGRTKLAWQVYIPGNVYNNPALASDGEYEATLMRMNSAMRRALLDNDWEVSEGTWVGDAWDKRVHVSQPFALPRNVEKFKCADYGRGGTFGKRGKTCVHWIAVFPAGFWVVYRSHTFIGLTARAVAMRIRQIESRPLVYQFKDGRRITITGPEWDHRLDCSMVRGPMDSSVWSKTGQDGPSMGEIFEELGVGFYPADRGPTVRESAADAILEKLMQRYPDPSGNVDPGIPGLMFFRGTTDTKIPDQRTGKSLLTGPRFTLPSLPFDEKDPAVPDTTADDDDWDALAYGVLTRVQTPEREDAEIIDFLAFRANEREFLSKAKSEGINW